MDFNQIILFLSSSFKNLVICTITFCLGCCVQEARARRRKAFIPSLISRRLQSRCKDGHCKLSQVYEIHGRGHLSMWAGIRREAVTVLELRLEG